MKMYLVRRKNLKFKGPMTVNDLRRQIKKMELTSADEVASGFGRWVRLDEIKRLKKYYPEIAEFSREHLSAWGVTSATAHEIRIKNSEPRKSPWLRNILIFLCIVAGGGTLAFFGLKNSNPKAASRILSKLKMKDDHLSTLNQFAQEGSARKIALYMESHKASVLKEAMKSKESFKKWLKYLRVLAFSNEGTIAGVSDTFLKGQSLAGAPDSCSLKKWENEWLSSQEALPNWLKGKQMVQKDWSSLLMWSPAWIQKRHSADWIWPANYYAACIIMADKSLQKVKSKFIDKEVYQVIENRLQFLNSTVLGKSSYEINEVSGDLSVTVLSALDCYENSSTQEAIAECSQPAEMVEPWSNLLELRKNWLLAGIYVHDAAEGRLESLKNIEELYPLLSESVSFIGLDYTKELEFLKKVMKADEVTFKSVFKDAIRDHPGVEYSH